VPSEKGRLALRGRKARSRWGDGGGKGQEGGRGGGGKWGGRAGGEQEREGNGRKEGEGAGENSVCEVRGVCGRRGREKQGIGRSGETVGNEGRIHFSRAVHNTTPSFRGKVIAPCR